MPTTDRGIHKAKCDYIINQLQRYKNDQKCFWKCIQSVMPSKETAKCIREVINPITGEKCDVKESVEVINRFFFYKYWSKYDCQTAMEF